MRTSEEVKYHPILNASLLIAFSCFSLCKNNKITHKRKRVRTLGEVKYQPILNASLLIAFSCFTPCKNNKTIHR